MTLRQWITGYNVSGLGWNIMPHASRNFNLRGLMRYTLLVESLGPLMKEFFLNKGYKKGPKSAIFSLVILIVARGCHVCIARPVLTWHSLGSPCKKSLSHSLFSCNSPLLVNSKHSKLHISYCAIRYTHVINPFLVPPAYNLHTKKSSLAPLLTWHAWHTGIPPQD